MEIYCVHPLTLTRLGERSLLLSKDKYLDINDISDIVEWKRARPSRRSAVRRPAFVKCGLADSRRIKCRLADTR